MLSVLGGCHHDMMTGSCFVFRLHVTSPLLGPALVWTRRVNIHH